MVLARPKTGVKPHSPTEGSARWQTTLHCGFAVAEDGLTAALTWTDSAGELAHGDVLTCDCHCSDECEGVVELCEDVLEATRRVRFWRCFQYSLLGGRCNGCCRCVGLCADI